MMSPGHAVSGTAVWLTGWAGAQALGLAQPGLDVVIIGTAICAGGAIYPDIDHPNSRVTKSGGLLTRVMSAAHAYVGVHVHAATKLDADRPDLDGHRTVSHTWLFAALVGALISGVAGGFGGDMLHRLVTWTTTLGGPGWQRFATAVADALDGNYDALVLAGIVYFFVSLGAGAALDVLPWRYQRVRLAGLLPTKTQRSMPWWLRRRKTRVATVLAAGSALAVYVAAPGSTWWLGLAVGIGCATHTIGDLITASGCPILWPVPIPSTELRWVRGGGNARQPVRVWRVWYLVGTPKAIRFRVGSPVETLVTWVLVAHVTAMVGMLTYLSW